MRTIIPSIGIVSAHTTGMKAMKRYWRIQCLSGLSQISEVVIPSGNITDQQLDSLLQTLASKHGLSDDEIALCFYRKNCKKYSSLLEVRYDQANRTRECGQNPYCTASLVDENGVIVPCPTLE